MFKGMNEFSNCVFYQAHMFTQLCFFMINIKQWLLQPSNVPPAIAEGRQLLQSRSNKRERHMTCPLGEMMNGTNSDAGASNSQVSSYYSSSAQSYTYSTNCSKDQQKQSSQYDPFVAANSKEKDRAKERGTDLGDESPPSKSDPPNRSEPSVGEPSTKKATTRAVAESSGANAKVLAVAESFRPKADSSRSKATRKERESPKKEKEKVILKLRVRKSRGRSRDKQKQKTPSSSSRGANAEGRQHPYHASGMEGSICFFQMTSP